MDAISQTGIEGQRGRLGFRPREVLGGSLTHVVGTMAAVIALGALFTYLNPRFLAPDNLGNILQQISILGMLAVALTFPIVAGEIDLSVGSNFGVCAVTFALLLKSGTPLITSIILTILAGATLGFLNGASSVVFGVPTIIVTLGTFNVYQGVSYYLSGGLPISSFSTKGPFFSFAKGYVFSWLPDLGLALLATMVAGYILITKTKFGHWVYATGSNAQAATNAGISISRIRIWTLVIVGITAGLAGALSVAQYGSASPSAGQGYNLDTIAAVIIGGAAIFGGRGSVPASVVGAFLIGEVRNGLVLAGVELAGQMMVTGLLIIVAVAIDRLSRGQTWYQASLKRQWRKRSRRSPWASWSSARQSFRQ